jgi:hypothetical protein
VNRLTIAGKYTRRAGMHEFTEAGDAILRSAGRHEMSLDPRAAACEMPKPQSASPRAEPAQVHLGRRQLQLFDVRK